MGHLVYTDGRLNEGQSITERGTLNIYFTNMQSRVYWSYTAYAPNPDRRARFFNTRVGRQDYGGQIVEFYAWAVRPGDVAVVPEPETYALLMAGLGLLGVVAKRRRWFFAAS